MCFLNIKACQHILLHQIHKLMIFKIASYDPFNVEPRLMFCKSNYDPEKTHLRKTCNLEQLRTTDLKLSMCFMTEMRGGRALIFAWSEAALVSVFGYYPSYTDWVFIPVLMWHTVAVRSLTLMACGFIKGVSVCFVPKIRLNSNTPIKHNTCWLQTLLRVQTA